MADNHTVEERCRLVLIVPPKGGAAGLLEEAVAGGDVASVILPKGEMAEAEYADHVEAITPVAQGADAAVIIEDDSQIMGRAGADGLFVAKGLEALKDTIARFSPKRIVGYGGVRTRHNAMEAAECQPDFLFLGKVEGDIRAEAHPRNLKLGEWCAEVMQTSIVVMGGSAIESVVEVAETGVEFVALSLAVFEHPAGPRAAVGEANALLDLHAPRFEDDA
jgi:thiamine-phosphate pyrophosphorylase